MKWFLLAMIPFLLAAYTPVITPNVSSLSWEMDGDVKVFRLKAEEITHSFSPGLTIKCWGYNGSTPGPTIEAVEGDKVRFVVSNRLPEPTTIHWHGILLPNRMDGVSGLTQAPILPGEDFVYEFTLKQSGTYLYHSHYDDLVQTAMGMVGFFVIHPKNEKEPPERDFAIFLQEWLVPLGASRSDPWKLDFNYFTFNGVVWPGAEPLIVKKGQRVKIRLGNLSMDSHPIHLHGYLFDVAAMGGTPIPKNQRYNTATINVPPGETREIEFLADAEGDWALHCHKSHHVMNGMSHAISNLMGEDPKQIEKQLTPWFPRLSVMGTNGMGEMFEMRHSPHIPNVLQMGSPGPYGTIEMSGMFTVLKVLP